MIYSKEAIFIYMKQLIFHGRNPTVDINFNSTNPGKLQHFSYLAHFDAVVECGYVERAAALVIGGGGGVRAACQHPAHEVLPAGVDGLVEGDVAAAVPQPQALRVAPVQDFERGQLALGRAAMRSTKTEKLTLIFGSI